jgi:hypothetical protein
MNGRHSIAHRIGNQDRQAIGSFHGKRDVFCPRCECISLRPVPLVRNILYDIDTVGMDLTESDKARVLKMKSNQEAASIFILSLSEIAGGAAEVE